MVIVQQFISILSNTPVLVSLFSIISLASVGKSLGVRRAYAKVLLKIFEVSVIYTLHTFILLFFVNIL